MRNPIGPSGGRFPVRKSAAVLQLECDQFNAANPIGTKVSVRLDSGAVMETVTTAKAWVMGGHSAMILVKGISGGYALERVKPGWAEEVAP